MRLTVHLAKAVLPAALVLACAAAAPTTAPTASPSAIQSPRDTNTSYEGITEPSKRLKLNLRSFVVKKVLKERGDKVKEGEPLLIVAEEAEEKAKLAIYQIDAESDVLVDVAKAKLEHAKNELNRIQQMSDKKVASVYELEKAKLEVLIAEKEILKAQQEQGQKKLQVKYQEALLQNMRIVSPIDGVVEEIGVREGEVVNPQAQEGAITLVKNDPMEVRVHLPTPLAQKMKVGQQLGVVFPGEQAPQMAEIYYRAPVADASADVQLLRLRLPNPQGRDSGMRVQVQVPTNGEADLAAKN